MLSDGLCGGYIMEQMNKTNARLNGGCFEMSLLYN